MRNLLTINISDNNHEIFVYDGEDRLDIIFSASDADALGQYVKSRIEEFVTEGGQ